MEDAGEFCSDHDPALSFNVVMVSDILDLREYRFQLDDEETVAVFSEFYLASLIASPNRLDTIRRRSFWWEIPRK
jgi:hypothetical protein